MRNFLFSFKTHIIGALVVGLSCASHASPQQEIANHLREGQLGQAAKLVATERKNNPKDVDIWFLEGVVQAQSGQTDKAVATFTRITQAHPQHAESYNNLGVLAAAKGQLGEARAFFEKALRTNPSYAAVHKNLGDVNSQLAKAAYGKALMVDSKDKPATVQLSMLASTSLFAASDTAPAINSSTAKPPASTEAAVKTSAPPKTAGRIYQQTFIDSYCKTVMVKLYDRKHAITAADMLNDRVLPWYEENGVPLLRILTDRGSEYCGNREHHEFALYLDLEGIDHTRTQTKSPQTNGICERFHQTIQNEFYASAFRRKLYTSLDQLQADVDQWVRSYNEERPHSGKHCFGKTPWQTFLDSKALALEKQLDRTMPTTTAAA